MAGKEAAKARFEEVLDRLCRAAKHIEKSSPTCVTSRSRKVILWDPPQFTGINVPHGIKEAHRLRGHVLSRLLRKGEITKAAQAYDLRRGTQPVPYEDIAIRLNPELFAKLTQYRAAYSKILEAKSQNTLGKVHTFALKCTYGSSENSAQRQCDGDEETLKRQAKTLERMVRDVRELLAVSPILFGTSGDGTAAVQKLCQGKQPLRKNKRRQRVEPSESDP
jgi:hypothetical protein